jgi:integrase
MRKQLTDAMLKKLAPPTKGKRTEVFDSIQPALAVRVTDNGAKSFIVRGRIKGRPKPIRITIGDALAMKLTDAREEASEICKTMRGGKDPREERRQAKIAAERAGELEFQTVVVSFITKYAKKNRTWQETEAIFKNHVTPHWNNRLITDISRADVAALLDRIEERSSASRANHVLAAVRKLFNWAMLRSLVDISPVMPGMARDGEEARTRFLSFDEIRIVWNAASQMGQPFGPFHQFLLLTGQRRSEAAGARWASLDLDGEKLWTLSPEETKAGREHFVPLPDMTRELLSGQPRINDPDTREPVYVFTTTGDTPISGFSKAKLKLDAEVEKIMAETARANGENPKPFPDWRVHDLRRTVATHMEDALGIPPHIVGSVLNHAPRGYKGVTSVYTRGSLIFERRRALIAWTRLLSLIIGRDGDAAWAAVAKISHPETEADAARTMEFRRMIQADDMTWATYLKTLTGEHTQNVVSLQEAAQ